VQTTLKDSRHISLNVFEL